MYFDLIKILAQLGEAENQRIRLMAEMHTGAQLRPDDEPQTTQTEKQIKLDNLVVLIDELAVQYKKLVAGKYPLLYPTADSSLETFTLYWRHGERTVIHGNDIADAFSRAGLGSGAVAAVDWYDRGDTDTHLWSKDTKTWVPRKPPISA